MLMWSLVLFIGPWGCRCQKWSNPVLLAARLYVDCHADRLENYCATVGVRVRRSMGSKNHEIDWILFEALRDIVGPSAKWVGYGSAAFEDFGRMREVIVP
tara:strand:- start:89 stop:388 length:300 start_codon:yes stop_codon:yes gene_type:complete